jgi:hypothetical protein
MESSSLQLKQSGMKDEQNTKKPAFARYPSQFDESSVRTDITEADIVNYVRRAATKAAEKEYDLSCYSSFQCDQDLTVEDCPQNQCYKQYLDPNYLDAQKLEPSKKIFFDALKDVISAPKHANFQDEPDSYVLVKNRVEDLLQNRNSTSCDAVQNNQPNASEVTEKQNGSSDNICSRARPNQCDPIVPNDMDCKGRECYKKYLTDGLIIKPQDEKKQPMPNGMRVKFGEQESFLPMKANSVSRHDPNQRENVNFVANVGASRSNDQDFQKKFNTLIVNSDISVPAFVDVLVVLSEKPIKITLPSLQGPSLASTIGKVVSSSNLLIKNLSLTTHQIVATGNNKIDTVRSSIAIEPAGKKTLGAINDTWILL